MSSTSAAIEASGIFSGDGKCKSGVQCRLAVAGPRAVDTLEIAADDDAPLDDAAGLGALRPHATSATKANESPARKFTRRM